MFLSDYPLEAAVRASKRVSQARVKKTPPALRWIGPDDEPAPGYRNVRYVPFPSQATFHELTPAFAKGFSGPMGVGKSSTLCHEVVKACYANPGYTGILAGPSYRQLFDSTVKSLFLVLMENNIPYRERKSDDAVVLTECGSEILLRSMETPKRFFSVNAAWVACDEAAICTEEAWNILTGRVRVGPAQSRFAVWTPKGYNWVYRSFKAEGKPAGNECVFARQGENTTLGADYYVNLSHQYDAKMFAQECEGVYTASGAGRAYYNFDRNVHLKPEIIFDHDNELWVSFDFNVDPAVCLLAHPHKEERQHLVQVLQMDVVNEPLSRILVFDEIFQRESNTPAVCAELWEKLSAWKVKKIVVFGDATGRNRTAVSGSNAWDVVKEWAAVHNLEVDYRVEHTNPLVEDRLHSTNAALLNAAGETRLFIHPRCEQLTRDLDEMQVTADGKHAESTDKLRGHLGDCLGYICHQAMGVHKPKSKSPWKALGF
jgi:hypothetical protein